MALNKRTLVLFSYRNFIRRPQHRIGASCARIVYGIWLLSFYLQSFTIRHFIWGSRGPIQHDIFLENLRLVRGFSVLSYSASPAWTDFLIILAIASASSLVLGLFTRSSLIVSCVLLWSFHERNPFILDGGDNMGRIILIILTLANCSSYFALDSHLRIKQRSTPLSNIFHNVALYAITVQYCLLYLGAGLAKIAGPLWQNGTALYYVFRSGGFAHPKWGRIISRHLGLVTVGSYLTIALQCAFPFLVWMRRFKVPIILSLIGMHVGIAYLMGLLRFSNSIIAGLLFLLPDKFYRRIGVVARGQCSWALRKLDKTRPPIAQPVT